MDVDAIPIGVDFRAHIDDDLAHTDVLLAVIGARMAGRAGRRRSENP